MDQREFMGRKLHVNVSIPATRLFIGSIPKDKTKEEFEAELIANNVEKVKKCKISRERKANGLKILYFYSRDSNIITTMSSVMFTGIFENVDCFAVRKLNSFSGSKGSVAAGDAKSI